MAEFSKQYCDQDDRDFAWDFDILEVAEILPNGSCIQRICEGYGFIAIGKNELGEIILAFRENKKLIWKPYPEIVYNN
jgi:hypothetical protein